MHQGGHGAASKWVCYECDVVRNGFAWQLGQGLTELSVRSPPERTCSPFPKAWHCKGPIGTYGPYA